MTANKQGLLASSLHPEGADDLDRLYELLPADLRRRDALGKLALKSLLRIVQSQYNLVENDILQSYDNLSVETCRADLLPYLGALLGFEFPKTTLSVQVGADSADTARDATLFRQLIGNYVAFQRRRGGIGEARQTLRTFGHTSSYLLETIDRVERTPSTRRTIRQTITPQELSPSVRRHLNPELEDDPFDVPVLTPEARRVLSDTGVTPGQAHPDGLEVHLGRLDAHPLLSVPSYCADDSDADPYRARFTFDSLGCNIPLLSAPLKNPGRGESGRYAQFVHQISATDLTRHILDYYGEGRSIFVRVGKQKITADQIWVGDLSLWKIPSTAPEDWLVVLDPERGRFVVNLESPHLDEKTESPTANTDYWTGRIGRVGGGGYPRQISSASTDTIIYVDPNNPQNPNTVGTLDEALDKFAKSQDDSTVIELVDNRTWIWDLNQVAISAGRRLIVRAASGVWPLIWARGTRPGQVDRIKFCFQINPNPQLNESSADVPGYLVLDGLRLAGRPLHIEQNLRVLIRDCTLYPGWTPECGTNPANPNAISLTLHGVRAGVVIDRSVVGRIRVLPQELGDPVPLVIRDSIVDARGCEHFMALAGVPHHDRRHGDCEKPPHAYVALVVRRSTIIGCVKVHQLVLAADSLLADSWDVARCQKGCLRYCYVPYRSKTPPRYRCQPDLASTDLRREIQQQCPTLAEEAIQPRLDALLQRLVPQFASGSICNPLYLALHSTIDPMFRTGAEDGGEFGVYHNLDLARKDVELIQQLSDSVPAGMDYRLIIHPRNVS